LKSLKTLNLNNPGVKVGDALKRSIYKTCDVSDSLGWMDTIKYIRDLNSKV